MAEATTSSRGSRRVGRYVLLTIAAALMFLPVYTALVGSVQPTSRLFEFPGVLIPRSIDLSPYGDAFRIGRLGRYLANSALVTSVIVVGQVTTSILAAYAFAFLLSWNQYLWPLLVTNEEDYRTVQIGLKALAATNVDQINVVLAGTVIAGAPIFVLLVLFQRQLVRGLTSGAVKG